MLFQDLFKKSPSRLFTVGALLAMILIVVLLSVFIFAQMSLRLDEAQSLFQTNRNVAGILYYVGQDVHVPFYHLLLHFWQLAFGNTIFAARMMSLVFFVAMIPLIYYLGSYSLSSRTIGLFAALLLTLSPFMNWYGSEARMYAMLAFFVIIHQIAFIKLLRTGQPNYWIYFVLTAIGGVYTHYFFGFILLTEGVFMLLLKKRLPIKRIFLKLVISAVIILLSLLPWLLYVFSLGFAKNTQPSLVTPTAVDLFGTYAQFMFGFQTNGINTIILSMWPILVLFTFFALRRRGASISNETLNFIAIATIPILGAFVISFIIKPIYVSRYLIVSLPAVFIFVSWLISQYRQEIALAVRVVLVILIVGLLSIEATNPDIPVQENYRGAVSYLNNHVQGDDVVVLAAPFTIYPVQYYYTGSAAIVTQPAWDRYSQGSVPPFSPSELKSQTDSFTQSYRHVWLLLSYDQGYNQKVYQYYAHHFSLLYKHTYSPGLTLYEYKVNYAPPVSAAAATSAVTPPSVK